MAQPRKKVFHPSDEWPVEEKRRILQMFATAPGPHLSVYRPTFDSLPTLGYIIPMAFTNASYKQLVDKDLSSKKEFRASFALWARDNEYPIPAIRFRINGKLSGDDYVSESSPEYAFGLVKSSSIEGWRYNPLHHVLWAPTAGPLPGVYRVNGIEISLNRPKGIHFIRILQSSSN